ncbi:MAG: ribosome hibernation-promoting factor, HPF/YfiA family [Burkholderiales bacterium]
MNLKITGHHISVTPALRTYVESKLERVVRHFDHVIDVSVILAVEKLKHRSEVTLHAKGKEIFVEAIGDNMYAAIDALVDKLDRAVLKHKSRAFAHPHDAIKHQAPIA